MTTALTTDLSESRADLTAGGARKLCDAIQEKIGNITAHLIELHNRKGWKALGYGSWKQCLKEEFGHSASWACRQIKAAEVRQTLPIGNELSEAQSRELAKVPEEKREAVLDWAEEKAAGNPVTAKGIAHAAKEFAEQEGPKDQEEPDETEAKETDAESESPKPVEERVA
jgi:hypothetical protein